MTTTAADIRAQLPALIAAVEAHRDQAEDERRLPDALIEAMVDARLFRMWVPRAWGGDERDLVTGLEVIDALAQADGSAAWVAMNLICCSALPGYLASEAVARDIVAHDDARVGCSGNVKPGAKAVAVPGGYRLTGHWGFGSGVHHATWMSLRAPVFDGDARRTTESGAPVVRSLLIPRAAIETLDTWFVLGMRGTGSTDFSVTDLFVPEERTYLVPPEPTDVSVLQRIPQLCHFSMAGAMVPLGIARAALTAFTELAASKRPTGSRQHLRDRETVQADAARAEALVRTNRAFIFETARELWDTAVRGDSFTLQQRARARLAATSATVGAAQAVDLLYNAGGGSSLYESCPLERHFRDVHAATQSSVIGAPNWETLGKVLLGMDVTGIRL